MSLPSSSGLAAVIVVFSSLVAVTVVFWTQHLAVLSLASTITKLGFSVKRSRPKRMSTSRYLSPSLSLSLSLSPSPSSKPDSDDFFSAESGERERSEKQKQQDEKEKAKMDKNTSDKVFDFCSCHQCFRVSILPL
ncbi:uncharacterized protein DS421_17g599850 [Arachis hypogaea]|nr:uncharacterized protein DS421_17g599850 [Arachis hypogaea]